MGSDTKKTYGAVGRSDLLHFDPEDLLVVTDKDHPLFDERALKNPEERVIASIIKKGIIKPVVVRKNGYDKDNKPIVEVVDGRQRVKAARIANMRLKAEDADAVMIKVPAVIRSGTGKELFSITIATNEISEKDGPLIRAKKLKRYLEMGNSLEDAQVDFGVTLPTLKSLLAILDCHEDVQKALEKGRIGITHCKALSALPQEEQPAALAKLLEKDETGEERSAEERLEDVVGDRGKIRLRKQKTKKQLKTFRKALEECRSPDAGLAIAMVDWFMGKPGALDKFRAIRSRAEGLTEEE